MTRALPAILVAVVGCMSSHTDLSGDAGADGDVTTDLSGDASTDGDVTTDGPSPDVETDPSGDLPVCTGPVTADIGGGCSPEGSEWYHGEHTCPEEVTCGEVTDCMAFSDWPYGTCICPEPSYHGDLSFIAPDDGAHLTMDADIDPVTPGLQIEVVLDAGCWMDYDFEWSLTLGICGDPRTEPEHLFEPDETGRASRVFDLDGFSGVTRICAWPVKEGAIEMGAVVSVHVGT